ncbi:MFS transporter [Acidilobus sp.]|uniref:MFS transporter n=1 Tax=Acidilobus sp. TaxID=1872109 RepID=UPI003D06D4F6
MSSRQGLIVASTTVSMVVYGLVLGLVPVAAIWSSAPSWAVSTMYLTIPVGTLAGNLIIGRLTDIIGRKPSFIVTLALYGVGSLVTLLSVRGSVYALLAGLAVAQVGLGGEMPAMLAYLAEVIEERWRAAALILITDVSNLGVLIDGLIMMLYQSSTIPVSVAVDALGAVLGVTIAVILVMRFKMPESPEWQSVPRESRGRVTSPGEGPGIAFRVTALTAFVIATALTYAFLALTIGPYLFPSETGLLLVIYNVGELVGGPIALALLPWGRSRGLALVSYLGGAVTMAVAAAALGLLRSSFTLFVYILLINGIFGEMAWAARVLLEPLAFPVHYRGTAIAIVRVVPYALYAASVFYLANVTTGEYMLYNVGLWAIGAAAGVAWYLRGPEVYRH